MARLLTIKDIEVDRKRVLVRVDFNVSLDGASIRSDARIRASLPTLRYLQEKNCQIIVCSHLGRPKEGQYDSQFSLAPIAQRLEELLSCPVKLHQGNIHEGVESSSEVITMLENVRFLAGEKGNDEDLARAYAKLCDVFVLDAFGSAHRGHASTLGVAQYAPQAVAGLLVEREVSALQKGLCNPKHPVGAIIGGSKTSTKLPVLESITDHVDFLIPGGGIANNFIASQGHAVGKSLWEPNLMETTKKLMDKSCEILVPSDVLVTDEISANAQYRYCSVDQVSENDIIVDIGPETITKYCQRLTDACTIIWNGPVGVFEIEAFSRGTREIGQAISKSSDKAFSIAGGGDTLNAIESFAIDNISYISTGGGAFLEFMEKLTLVALEPLFQE